MSPPGGDKGPAGGEGDVRSPFRWLLVAVALAPVLFLTLRPALDTSWVGAGLLCVWCGHAGAANLVRNVVLFVPLGAALAHLLGPSFRAVAVAFLLTATIESLQFHIPGRNPGLADLVANAAGAALAVGVLRRRSRWLRLRRGPAARRSLAWGAAAAAMLFATAFLFSTDLPRTTWFAHLRPDLEHLEFYRGQVRDVSVGGASVRIGMMEDPDAVRDALLAGAPVRVRAVAGPPPSGVAPLFMITSGAREEMVLVGVQGSDLVARIRFRAVRFGFERPDLRLRDALRRVDSGEELDLAFQYRGGASCLALNGEGGCGLGPGVERGWSLLLYPGGAPHWTKRLLDLLWMMGLTLPFGFFARGHLLSWLGGGALLLGATSGWWLAAVASPSAPGLLGVVAGMLTGRVLSRVTAGE